MNKGLFRRHVANTWVYILCMVLVADGGELKAALSPLGLWNDVWILAFGFGIVVLYGLVSDWLLLNGHDIAWRRMNDEQDRELTEARRKLLEQGNAPMTKRFANGALLAMMLAVAAAFVWFAFLA